MIKKIIVGVVTLIVAAASLAAAAFLVVTLLFSGGNESRPQSESVKIEAYDRFNMYMTNQISNALDGVLEIEKVYWLSDDDLIAPKPNQELFGTTDDPSTLAGFLEDAQSILDGQSTVFTTETELTPGTIATYYLDETIFAITWKMNFNNVMYTFSEVKIAHPSQFRRFLAGGTYGSDIRLTTTQMAESVNAVVASSGDFYGFRRMGIIVYDGVVQRVNAQNVDTCYVDENGDLLFSYRGELDDMESAQKFVDENNIRFSVAFGPALIDKGVKMTFPNYLLGEVRQRYARAAICQMDELHYLLVTAGSEGRYKASPTVPEVQEVLYSFKPWMAYSLDGGQTAAIVMNNKLINRVVYDHQRNISDIIYFATAIPSGE